MNAIDRGQIVIHAAYALVGFSAFIIARMVMEEQESRAAQENLADLRGRKSSNELVRILRPLYTQYIVPVIRGKPFWDTRRKEFKRRVIAAGLKDEFTPDEFIAFKITLILVFPLIGIALKVMGLLDPEWYYILGSGGLGWFYPNIWVNNRIAARQKKVLRAMPFIVDLLALSTEAGLDFVGAIGKVVEKASPSPLVEEFGQLLKEIKVGSSRQEGLREMAARISMPEVNSFVAILISADQMGASIGKILRQQSEQIRSERMVRAEKAGAAAAQKVLLPTALFILPAVILMIFAPFILGFLNGGGA
ncbi:MAG: type II secretion system F family protein [Bdellovibrio sp.]|nr:type II secretion system F family protein [Bdellovibrio sp.]